MNNLSDTNTITLEELKSKSEKKIDLTSTDGKNSFNNFLYFAFSHRDFRKIIVTEVDNYMNRLIWWRIVDTVCHCIFFIFYLFFIYFMFKSYC